MSTNYKKEFIELFGDQVIRKGEDDHSLAFDRYLHNQVFANNTKSRNQHSYEYIAADYIVDNIYPDLKNRAIGNTWHLHLNQIFFDNYKIQNHMGMFEDNLCLNGYMPTQSMKRFNYCRFSSNTGTMNYISTLLPKSSTEQKAAVLKVIKDKLIYFNYPQNATYLSYPQMVQKIFLLEKLSEDAFFENRSANAIPIDSSKDIAQANNECANILAFPLMCIPEAGREYKNAIKKLAKTDKSFARMIKSLFIITDGNINSLSFLAILIAKINMGRDAFASYAQKYNSSSYTNNLTLLCCNNARYMRDFFKNIFTWDYLYSNNIDNNKLQRINSRSLGNMVFPVFMKGEDTFYHFTEYDLPKLTNTASIPELLEDKAYGHLLNVDAMLPNKRDVDSATLNKLIKGHICTHHDELFGRLSYRSNSQYIRIIKDMSQCGFDTDTVKEFDCVQLSKDLPIEISYEQLENHEIFFLHTDFVKYGFDLISGGEENKNALPVVLGAKEAADSFCQKYLKQTDYDLNTTDGITYMQDIFNAYKDFVHTNHANVDILNEPSFYDAVKENFPEPETEYKNLRLKADQKKETSTKGNAAAAYGLAIDIDKLEQDKIETSVRENSMSERYDDFKRFFAEKFGINC